MYDFAYHRPKTLADAVSGLKGKPDGKAMAGGMTLIPTLKLRLAKPSDVVDLVDIKDLTGMQADGPGVSHGTVTENADDMASRRGRRGDTAYHRVNEAVHGSVRRDCVHRHPCRAGLVCGGLADADDLDPARQGVTPECCDAVARGAAAREGGRG